MGREGVRNREKRLQFHAVKFCKTSGIPTPSIGGGHFLSGTVNYRNGLYPSTWCELILLSTNSLVSPKDTEAMVGWCPNSGSPSVCHDTWSFLSRYKLHNTEFSVKLISFSTLVLILCKDGGHCGWIIEIYFRKKHGDSTKQGLKMRKSSGATLIIIEHTQNCEAFS